MMAACYRVRSYDKMWNNTRIIGATFEEKKTTTTTTYLYIARVWTYFTYLHVLIYTCNLENGNISSKPSGDW